MLSPFLSHTSSLQLVHNFICLTSCLYCIYFSLSLFNLYSLLFFFFFFFFFFVLLLLFFYSASCVTIRWIPFYTLQLAREVATWDFSIAFSSQLLLLCFFSFRFHFNCGEWEWSKTFSLAQGTLKVPIIIYDRLQSDWSTCNLHCVTRMMQGEQCTSLCCVDSSNIINALRRKDCSICRCSGQDELSWCRRRPLEPASLESVCNGQWDVSSRDCFSSNDPSDCSTVYQQLTGEFNWITQKTERELSAPSRVSGDFKALWAEVKQ